MFYTFKRHDTVAILKEQSRKAAVSGGDVEKAMLKIKDIGRQFYSEMQAGSVKNFGKLMHEHWLTKKTISTKMSDSWLDGIYDLALQNGAEGGKIMGSGGGGCFLFFVPEKQPEFIAQMKKNGLKYIQYKFWPKGSEVIFHND
jgi:D-glycero-alpha-D-manno-heptose-7-phosphate kinase